MRFIASIFILLFTTVVSTAAELPAIEIMQRNYEVNRTPDRVIDITMEMFSKSGKKRVRRLTNAAILTRNGITEKRLLRFFYPPDIQGTGFLVVEQIDADDNMWLYLPSLRKSRRKLASDKKDSFMGTQFTYGDITGPKVPEFNYELKGKQSLGGFDCYVIESVPATAEIQKNYGYSRRTDYIRTDIFTHQKAVFYDLSGKLLKTLTCFEPYEADKANNKWFIKKREMMNHQNLRKTVLTMENIRVNLGLDEKFFSVRKLEDAL